MTPEKIVSAAFSDELEKIAKSERYLRLLTAYRNAKGAGKDVSRLKKDLDTAYEAYQRRVYGPTKDLPEKTFTALTRPAMNSSLPVKLLAAAGAAIPSMAAAVPGWIRRAIYDSRVAPRRVLRHFGSRRYGLTGKTKALVDGRMRNTFVGPEKPRFGRKEVLSVQPVQYGPLSGDFEDLAIRASVPRPGRRRR